jgi:hypothetical protein
MACGGSVMVVTFLGWWTWTACFFCLLATEIPTGRRSRGRARPGRKIVQRASGSERVRDEESCEPSGQAQRSRGLARSGPPVKIEGPEDKSSSLVHQELFDFRRRGRSWVLVPSTSKTNAAPPAASPPLATPVAEAIT